ncbi:hypothetical protein IRP61_10775 (plasmid) [Clostridium botulinum]|nr:hypothetical protein [Clostridium botulinum]QPW56529.1 hypothetical protein IRP61_10775 [Clostridium botulinum]
MVRFGGMLSHIGMMLMPISTSAYIFLRFCCYIWSRDFNLYLKAGYYFSLWLCYITNDSEAQVLITCICLIDSVDLIIDQKIKNRKSKGIKT